MSGLGREHRERELAHAASSDGERYESASATCSGLHGFRAPRGRRSSAPRVRRARGRAPTAAAARPRARAARRRRACAAAARPRAGSRAGRPARDRRRMPPTVRPRARPHAGAARRRRGRSGRAARATACRGTRSRRCAEHVHSAPASPRAPHGQRFIVATSWKRAGNTARPAARAIATTPSSSGCRSASSVGRGNSGSSSSSSTPWCARLASPGPDAGPAADDRGRRRRVVRRAERAACARAALRRQEPGDGVDPRDLERRVGAERRQDPGQPPREHRLARARRPGEQQVVPAGGGDLERAPRPLLAAHVGEVRHARAALPPAGRHGSGGSQLAAEVRDGLGEVARPARASTPASAASGADSGGHRSSSIPSRRAPSATARTPPTGRRRPSSASSPTAACRRSSDCGIWREAARRASAIGRSKPGALLAQPRGCEVDGDAAARAVELRRGDAAADARARLLRRRGRRGRRSRTPARPSRDVRLDLDAARLEADERMRDRPCEHTGTLRPESVRFCRGAGTF